MAKITAPVLYLLVFLAIYASAGLGKRAKRGFYNSGYGNNGRSGDSEERDASREDNDRDCDEDNENSGSREIAYNRDGRQIEKHRAGRSFTKSTSSASATSFNKAHNGAV